MPPDDGNICLEPLPTTAEHLLERLVALGIDAATHHHPPLFTVAESKALRGDLPGGHCKSLLLKDKKNRLWLVVTLEDEAINLKVLAGQLGCGGLSFASATVLWQVLGVRPGSVTPFALINDTQHRVMVVLSATMLGCDRLNYHPLENDRTTALCPSELLKFIHACGHTPRVIGLSHEMPGTGLDRSHPVTLIPGASHPDASRADVVVPDVLFPVPPTEDRGA